MLGGELAVPCIYNPL